MVVVIRLHVTFFFVVAVVFFSDKRSFLQKCFSAATAATTTKAVPDFGPNFVPSNLDNMNGFYPLSKTPGAAAKLKSEQQQQQQPQREEFPRQYKDYPGGAESFEVYSPPMTTLYSQVWWKSLEPVELPSRIIEKYNGKGMAIVGWEIDQVRQDENGEEVSVPISASYNHHYVSFLIGREANYRKVLLEGPDDPLIAELIKQNGGGCGGGLAGPIDQPHYLIEGPEVSSTLGLPTHQAFNSGNGGEYRKTFHGFSPGNALVIDSPTKMQINPMQIDTWNRDKMDISSKNKNRTTKFVAGPLPRASLAGHDSLHSGLLECPMTTRLTKVIDTATYEIYVGDHEHNKSMCEEPIVTSYECFEAAAGILLDDNIISNKVRDVLHNETGKYPNLPIGCSIVMNKRENGYSSKSIRGSHHNLSDQIVVYFNELKSSDASCSNEVKCVCPKETTPFGEAKGALLYHQTNQSVDVGHGKAAYFSHKCASFPSTTLLNQKNPTCDIRYYRGGQWACNHMWSLLDADQEIPWTNKPLVFRHKYRFWVQPYVESYHQPTTLGKGGGSSILIGSPWEYDVPKCSHDISGCEYVDGTWIYTIQGSTMGKYIFTNLNNHCHAPTCVSASVYACPKGTPLGECNASTGQLICETKPIYGGTNHPALVDTPQFDEPGYIAIPDCVWGSEEFGLESPLDLDNVPLHMVKKANATEPHYGEMSGGQSWVIVTPKNNQKLHSQINHDAVMAQK